MFCLKTIVGVITILLIRTKWCSCALEECYKEDFDDGTLGIFDGECFGNALFEVKKYADFLNIEKPPGANDFFITSKREVDNCIEISNLDVENGTEVQMSVFTINPSDSIIAILMVLESSSGIIIGQDIVKIDDSKIWKTAKIEIAKSTNAKIRFQCDELLSRNAFIAIDYIRIKKADSIDCINVTVPPPSPTNPGVTVPPSPTDPGVTVPPSPTDPGVTVPPSPTDPGVTVPPSPTDPGVTVPPSPTDPGVTVPPSPTDPSVTNPLPITTKTTTFAPTTSIGSDWETWRIISIIALSISIFVLIYSIVITTFIYKNQPSTGLYKSKNDNGSIESDLHSVDSKIPRLQKRTLFIDGQSVVDITGKRE